MCSVMQHISQYRLSTSFQLNRKLKIMLGDNVLSFRLSHAQQLRIEGMLFNNFVRFCHVFVQLLFFVVVVSLNSRVKMPHGKYLFQYLFMHMCVCILGFLCDDARFQCDLQQATDLRCVVKFTYNICCCFFSVVFRSIFLIEIAEKSRISLFVPNV